MIKISPLISIFLGGDEVLSFCGISRIVETLPVIISPFKPSPLVAAITKSPFSYTRLTDNPSIFGSIEKSKSVSFKDKNLLIFLIKLSTSSLVIALSNESILVG